MVVWGETLRRREWAPPPRAVVMVILVGILVIVPSFAALYMLLASRVAVLEHRQRGATPAASRTPAPVKPSSVTGKSPVRRSMRGR